MPTEVILPRVDMDMAEGMIAAWYVGEGDTIREGAVMFEIETSKATMEVDAPASGIIRQISAPVGTQVPVGTTVAWIYQAGEALVEHAIAATSDAAHSMSPARSAPSVLSVSPAPQAPDGDHAQDEASKRPVKAIDSGLQSADARAATGAVRATPAARRLARENGLQLDRVVPSGPNGRVEARDILRGLSQGIPLTGITPDHSVTELHCIWLRKASGCPLVLLHGFAAESNSWRPLFNALKHPGRQDFGVLAIDLPAHGKSSAEAADSLEQIVAAIEHTLALEGIRNCHLAGHSFGGAIALALATHARDLRVDSLSLIAPAGLGPQSNGAFMRGITESTRRASLVAWLKQLFANPAIMDEGFIATAEQQLADPATRARLAAVAERFFPDGAQALDLRAMLADTTMPVRVIWGLADRILPASHAEGLPGRIAVHRFANVGHLPHVEALDAVAQILADNIASALHDAPNSIECMGDKTVR